MVSGTELSAAATDIAVSAAFNTYTILMSALSIPARIFIRSHPPMERLKRAEPSHACPLDRSGAAARPRTADTTAVFCKAPRYRQNQPRGRVAYRDPRADVLGGADYRLCLGRVVSQLTGSPGLPLGGTLFRRQLQP